MEQQTTQVLVVDDNPEIRDIIHVLLEGEGIRVTEAADGSSALQLLTVINLWAFPAAGTIIWQSHFPIRNFSDAPER